MENPYEIQKFSINERFHANLKNLKKNAQRKKRQSFLKNFSIYLSHCQTITLIKFQPKLYLKASEILSLISKFEEPDFEPFSESNIISLSKFERKENLEKLFFVNNNISLYHHLSFPIHYNLDLNVDASIFSKNEYLFYIFNIYASYNVSDIRIKVFFLNFLFKFIKKKLKQGLSLGNQFGGFVSLEKSIEDNKTVGIDINIKRVNFARKELLTIWLRKNFNGIYLFIECSRKKL